MNIKEIRELAQKFSTVEIETCITQQLQEGINECKLGGPTDHVINELSKAEYVSNRMADGVSVVDAMRELAKQIRNVQSGFENGS
ncbi:MAG: hypothetical protein HQK92_01270 [Nitrospirae bacterium]|nr:hypothetical protein [Nitrospirota bacterium]